MRRKRDKTREIFSPTAHGFEGGREEIHTTSWSFKGGPESDLHWGKKSSAATDIGWRNLLKTAGRRSFTLTYITIEYKTLKPKKLGMQTTLVSFIGYTKEVPNLYEKSRTATSLLGRRFITSSGHCTYITKRTNFIKTISYNNTSTNNQLQG